MEILKVKTTTGEIAALEREEDDRSLSNGGFEVDAEMRWYSRALLRAPWRRRRGR
jgi:hypothetical protein